MRLSDRLEPFTLNSAEEILLRDCPVLSPWPISKPFRLSDKGRIYATNGHLAVRSVKPYSGGGKPTGNAVKELEGIPTLGNYPRDLPLIFDMIEEVNAEGEIKTAIVPDAEFNPARLWIVSCDNCQGEDQTCNRCSGGGINKLASVYALKEYPGEGIVMFDAELLRRHKVETLIKPTEKIEKRYGISGIVGFNLYLWDGEPRKGKSAIKFIGVYKLAKYPDTKGEA